MFQISALYVFNIKVLVSECLFATRLFEKKRDNISCSQTYMISH